MRTKSRKVWEEPGHTGEVGLPGTQVIEFSPADEYDETLALVAKNLEAAGT